MLILMYTFQNLTEQDIAKKSSKLTRLPEHDK